MNYFKEDKDLFWENQPLTGLSPGKLCRHGAWAYNNKIYIFGGKKTVNENNNDIFYYNFDEKLWFKIYIGPCEVKPKKIESFSLSFDKKEERVVIFGGFYGKFTNNLFFFHLKEKKWEKINCKGIKPDKRAGHCSVLYKDKMLFVSGGGDFEKKFHDLWFFDLDNLYWCQVDSNERLYKV